MSDTNRFVPPPWIPEAGAWTGADVADQCPGALVEGRREPCTGTVLKVRRGSSVYRYALCARCTGIESEARARASAARAEEPKTSRRAKVGT